MNTYNKIVVSLQTSLHIFDPREAIVAVLEWVNHRTTTNAVAAFDAFAAALYTSNFETDEPAEMAVIAADKYGFEAAATAGRAATNAAYAAGAVEGSLRETAGEARGAAENSDSANKFAKGDQAARALLISKRFTDWLLQLVSTPVELRRALQIIQWTAPELRVASVLSAAKMLEKFQLKSCRAGA